MGRVVLRVIWRPSMISRVGLATESNVESYGGRATTALAQRVRQHRGTDGRGGHWHRAAGARPCRRRRPAAPGRAAVPARRRGQSHAAGRRHARRRAYPAGTRSCHCRLPHRGRAAGGPGRPVRRAVANCRQPAADQARAGRRLPGHRLRTAGPHGRRCARDPRRVRAGPPRRAVRRLPRRRCGGRGDRRGAAARAFGSAAGGTGQPGQPHHREPAVKQPPRRASRTAPVRPAPLAAAPVRNWLRQPAYWLLMGLLLAGAWRLGAMLRPAVTAFPLSTALAIVLFGLYAVPFMLFIRHLDYFEREPPVLLAAVFAWGALVAVTAAVPGNAALNSLVAKVGSPAFAATWGPALAAPVVEEPLKLLGVVVVALLATEQINSVVDGFVYGAVAGLGFQVIENVLYAANAVAAAGLGDRAGSSPACGATRCSRRWPGPASGTRWSATSAPGRPAPRSPPCACSAHWCAMGCGTRRSSPRGSASGRRASWSSCSLGEPRRSWSSWRWSGPRASGRRATTAPCWPTWTTSRSRRRPRSMRWPHRAAGRRPGGHQPGSEASVRWRACNGPRPTWRSS